MISVFDLCGTLYRENTTFAFVEHAASRPGDWRTTWVRRRRSPPLRVLNRVLFAAGIDVCRAFAARAQQGESRDVLEARARVLLQRLTPVAAVHRHLDACRERGDVLVLASASFDFIAGPIGRALGFHHVVSTELAWGTDGRCLGVLRRDLLGRKWDAVAPLLGAGGFEVVTDNLDDIDLVRRSAAARAVSRRRHGAYWAAAGATVLDWID